MIISFGSWKDMANTDALGKGIHLELLHSIKGWPVKGVESIQEATTEIFGSPFWDIPEDTYQIVDNNEVYTLVAVVVDQNRISRIKRYLAINNDLIENSRKKDIP